MALNHSLNRSLARASPRYATRMLAGARRPRPVDHLRAACRLITLALRIGQRLARRDPHIFGPHAQRYFLDTLRLEQQQRATEAALNQVYGPPAVGEPPPVSTLWTDRYFPQSPAQKRIHLKWFKEQYGKG